MEQKRMDPNVYKATTQGNVQLLKQLIQDDPDALSSVTPQRNTALNIAARLGHKDLAEAILRECNLLLIVTKNNDEDTPIHIAARAGHMGIVASLINYSCTIQPMDIEKVEEEIVPLTIINKIGNTALHEAVQNGHSKIALKLLSAEPSASHIMNSKKETPLHIAAREGLKEVVLEILKYERVEAPDEGGTPRLGTGSPLHQAVLGGHCAIVEILLKQRADFIKLSDEVGNHALHYAAQLDNSQMVGMLLVKDPSLAYISNKEGWSSLHVAAANNSMSAIKEILKHCPDTAEQVDRRGRNALHIAVGFTAVGALKSLLVVVDNKEIINQTDENGNTPLHLAAMQGRFSSATLLLYDKRVDPCILNNDGQTAGGVIQSMEEVNTSQLLKRSEKHRCIKRHGQLESSKPRRHKLINSLIDDHFKSCVQSYTIVATLIATVTFAANFAMPGGYNQTNGFPLLADLAAFKVFVIFNTIAMCSSLVVVFCCIWAWKDPMRFRVQQLTWAHRLTVVSSLTMIIALMAAVYVVMESVCKWVAIVVCFICCSAPFLLWAILGSWLYYPV